MLLTNIKIVIASDHTGVAYKELIKEFFSSQKLEIKDFGTTKSEAVDYPDFIHLVAKAIEKKEADLGIILCGSGNGAAMTANKYQRVRAALVFDKKQAILAKAHNDANVISLGARFIKEEDLIEILKAFLDTEFEGADIKKELKKYLFPELLEISPF